MKRKTPKEVLEEFASDNYFNSFDALIKDVYTEDNIALVEKIKECMYRYAQVERIELDNRIDALEAAYLNLRQAREKDLEELSNIGDMFEAIGNYIRSIDGNEMLDSNKIVSELTALLE